MKRRDAYHICESALKAYHCVRVVDNMEGTLTICDKEKHKLEMSKWFKFFDKEKVEA
jgi:hypothetical protein